jgi:hypothetical protein
MELSINKVMHLQIKPQLYFTSILCSSKQGLFKLGELEILHRALREIPFGMSFSIYRIPGVLMRVSLWKISSRYIKNTGCCC